VDVFTVFIVSVFVFSNVIIVFLYNHGKRHVEEEEEEESVKIQERWFKRLSGELELWITKCLRGWYTSVEEDGLGRQK